MLGELSGGSELPLPRVVHASPRLLALEYVEHDGGRTPQGEAALADLMADLHARDTGCRTFGLERDTRIGPLTQPNGECETWDEFYRRHRLEHFGSIASDRGVVSDATLDGLADLYAKMSNLALSADEIGASRRRVYGYVRPDGMTHEQLAAAVTAAGTERSHVVDGAGRE